MFLRSQASSVWRFTVHCFTEPVHRTARTLSATWSSALCLFSPRTQVFLSEVLFLSVSLSCWSDAILDTETLMFPYPTGRQMSSLGLGICHSPCCLKSLMMCTELEVRMALQRKMWVSTAWPSDEWPLWIGLSIFTVESAWQVFSGFSL